MNWREELETLLRPAGGGVFLVSTGRAEQLALQQQLYGATDEAGVQAKWRAAIAAIPTARGIILGVPSDVGAGFRRGANLGPQVVRQRMLAMVPEWGARLAEAGIVDIGDVFVVPQLLHDDMLSEGQLAATRAQVYPRSTEKLPVSPLSIAERAFDLILAQNPNVKPFVIGGDHSNAWPVVAALGRARKDKWAIVQPDAHTDLLETRLGIKYCFATWSYHANDMLGRGGRMVQIGTRASGKSKQHWESTLDVRQFWAHEVREDPTRALDELLAHLKNIGTTGVYFSNDIDGTDDHWADATGTPEPNGLSPDVLFELIRRLGAEVGIIGGDIMEVAPPLRDDNTRTTVLAARYLIETMRAALRIESDWGLAPYNEP
ncbi:MAG TPA: arginase family protein [Kofleriaceae bacterium]|jgi:agmatinase